MEAFVQRLPRPQSQTPSRSPTRPSPLGERPTKRARVIEDSDRDDDDESKSADEEADTSGLTIEEFDGDEEDDRPFRQTAIESALPPIQTDKDAIAEYELMRSSQASAPDDETPAKTGQTWVRGKSSIYVDAFN